MSSDPPTHLGEPRLWSGSDQFAQDLSDAQLRLARATLDHSALLPAATSVCVSLSLRSVCLPRFSILGCSAHSFMLLGISTKRQPTRCRGGKVRLHTQGVGCGVFAQLAAGTEHIIAGKTVRVNVAGPRPELPLLYLQQGRVQQAPMAPPSAAGESHPFVIPQSFSCRESSVHA